MVTTMASGFGIGANQGLLSNEQKPCHKANGPASAGAEFGTKPCTAVCKQSVNEEGKPKIKSLLFFK
jgi:hypothetical protein